VNGSAGTYKGVCLRCYSFAVTVTDGRELTDLQRELIRIIHRRH
jgi:hypothetical protein